MKSRITFVLALALLVAACSFLSSPTGVVKKFMAAAQKGDADAMTQLFSKKAVQRLGLERIRSNNQIFCETLKRGAAEHGEYRIEYLQENSTPDGKWVSLTFKPQDESGALTMAFALSKESGVWRIDDIGAGNGPGNAGSSSPTPAPPNPIDEPPASSISSPSSPTAGSKNDASSSSTSQRAPISGGVLNSRALSLPAPAYPPAARAVKAAGTVVVQVTVDESGNVISARAVSGHPLLQAAAVAAARAAKFSPVKLSGEPVKVNGMITYNFAPQ
ncbi:MAG TPA: TonB family protein [Pyrinomonadaceae bacterium]